MEPFENLRSMAEVAVSLTGFTGIVVALGKRSHGSWTKLELLRLKMLLITSLAVLFFSLLPLALSGLNFSGERIWMISNATLAISHLLGLIITGLLARKMDISEWTASEKKVELIFSVIILPISLSLIICQSAFIFHYFRAYGFILFYLGLIYFLILSAIHFILLLLPDR